MTIYKFSEQQFEAIQSALNAAIGMALRFDKSMIGKMSTASSMMDDVANDEGDLKPFSTYPEDREKLMSLARVLQAPHDVETGEKAADELSDLVLAILSDEETDAFDADLDAADLMKIDEAWEKHKAAGPVAKVINDNQPGNMAIVEILRDPPTLEVGSLLFALPTHPQTTR